MDTDEKEDMKTLHYQRGKLKSSLTRFKTFILSVDKENLNVNMIKAKLEKVEPLWETFDEVQSKIERFDLNNKEEFKEREVFEDNFFEVISKARSLLEQGTVKFANLSEHHGSISPASVCSGNHGEGVVRLPTIELPTFDGKWEKFRSFKEEFDSLVNSRSDLATVQKFRYLVRTLKGDAALVIKSMEVTAENYLQAWEALEDRFDSKRRIVNKHVKAILDCDKIEKCSSDKIQSLIDIVSIHLRALKSLGLPTDQWDALLVPIVVRKLDSATRWRWSQVGNKNEVPSIKQLFSFLQEGISAMEDSQEDRQQLRSPQNKYPSNTSKSYYASSSANNASIVTPRAAACYFCEKEHKIFACRLFRALSTVNKINEVKRLNLCENCFRRGHSADNCSGLKCRICSLPHNTMLHKRVENLPTTMEESRPNRNSVPANESSVNASSNVLTHNSKPPKQIVLLSTAVVHVTNEKGKTLECRVLLDSGSQSNFVTQRVANHLNLTASNKNIAISGIGGAVAEATRVVSCKVKSRYEGWDAMLEFIILPQITLPIPEVRMELSSWEIPADIFLADPNFYYPGQIDMLIGAGEFFSLLKGQKIELGDNLPILHHTKLGWVIAGKISQGIKQERRLDIVNCGCCTTEELLRKFWEVEEVNVNPVLSQEEKLCEQIFVQTVRRDGTGRFIVDLPLKKDIVKLGSSERVARERFHSLERRLKKNSELKVAYSAFIAEYIKLGHMKRVEDNDKVAANTYYLPHHCVINNASSTTKLRVVFDASAKSDTGVSLNDVMMVGPTIQEDLFSIILRFRQHRYVITADITKMYRQIKINEEQVNLQRIFWRNEVDDPLESYCLTTVTYGTAAASYLATRCLRQAILEEPGCHPATIEAGVRDFYMDDLLTGSESLGTLATIQEEITEVLSKARFELHKWCANEISLLESIPEEHREQRYVPEEKNNAIKTLGLWWNPDQDSFKFSINLSSEGGITKRNILSETARIFDPLGILGPVTVKAKIFLQGLWALKINWDEVVTDIQRQEWTKYRAELTLLETIEIPRSFRSTWMGEWELHGFSDASEKAYGAAMYVSDTHGMCYLLCAKAKVAPLKKLSLPRLELCGALLLARLYAKVRKALSLKFEHRFLWCDSTIVLAWLNSPSSRWKTFIANRVNEIQELTAGCKWLHIDTVDNPADKISRGMYPSELVVDKLWWHGPPWICDKTRWPVQSVAKDTTAEQKSSVALASTVKERLIVWERFSVMSRLIRCIAYVLRFISRCRKLEYSSGPISRKEWVEAELVIVRQAQLEDFPLEIGSLKRKQQLPLKSKLLNLSPFLDELSLMRVGGRLSKAAALPYNQRHPYLLSDKHHFTKLMIAEEHVRNLHAGPQLLLSTVRQKYWPLNGRNLARKIVHLCMRCYKTKPKAATQLMGDLPIERLQSVRAFTNTGVDYCGPIFVKTSNLRNAKIVKTYVAIFICLAVKAVHIELVGDLTTASFIAAFKRFAARRGKPGCMFSDNGKNFVGAERELSNHLQQLSRNEGFHNYLVQENIEWKFIPPHAPQFGGLWEAAVKSFKFHLKRVVGQANLSYEEMSTCLALIEACLNSRPLCPLNSNPNDPSPLTPGHFLTGGALTAIPQAELTERKLSSLTRWHRVEQMFQHFWKRWTKEYLCLLQTRTKWSTKQPNIKVGQLVLLKDDNLPPLKWALGRVKATHPGSDDLIRVVTLKTNQGELKRPISKICPLVEEAEKISTNSGDVECID